MEVYSADITTFTSSFRYPMLISGTQLTLEVPPISTILGLINAAAGRHLKYSNCLIGYFFKYEGKGLDVETIYMAEVGNMGSLMRASRSNIVKREFTFDNFLRIYSPNKEIFEYLQAPYYPLVLGRSSDLATVDINSIQKRDLRLVTNADKIKGQVIPFAKAQLPGRIQPLSQYFTDSYPRQLLGKEPYCIINCSAVVSSSLQAYRDEIHGEEVDIFFHEINSDRLY